MNQHACVWMCDHSVCIGLHITSLHILFSWFLLLLLLFTRSYFGFFKMCQTVLTLLFLQFEPYGSDFKTFFSCTVNKENTSLALISSFEGQFLSKDTFISMLFSRCLFVYFLQTQHKIGLLNTVWQRLSRDDSIELILNPHSNNVSVTTLIVMCIITDTLRESNAPLYPIKACISEVERRRRQKSGAKNKMGDESSECDDTTFLYGSRQTVKLMQNYFGYFSNETIFFCSYMFTIL